MRSCLFSLCLNMVAFFSSTVVHAQDDAAELAKKLANPIASLISLPLQNNTDYGIGNFKGSRNTMNVQPVVPVTLSKNLNLIARWVQPIITQYNITGAGQKQSGFGDAVVSAFLSPSNTKNGFTWGVGPVFLVPVASARALATKQFGIGPTAVALKQFNGWTIGGLANQIWRVAGGDNKPDVNQFFLQPFFNYNWKTGAGAGANLEWTHNWTAKTDVLWLNPTISGVTSLGKQKTQFAVGPRFNLAAPSAAKADLGWRAVVVFLFPK